MRSILNPRQKVNLTAFISERVSWIFRETQCSERNNHQPLNKITNIVERHPESRCMQPKYCALCKPQVEVNRVKLHQTMPSLEASQTYENCEIFNFFIKLTYMET
jgi:hypothetical protein